MQQVLARRGLIGDPRIHTARPPQRFEGAAGDELGQIDGAYHELADRPPTGRSSSTAEAYRAADV